VSGTCVSLSACSLLAAAELRQLRALLQRRIIRPRPRTRHRVRAPYRRRVGPQPWPVPRPLPAHPGRLEVRGACLRGQVRGQHRAGGLPGGAGVGWSIARCTIRKLPLGGWSTGVQWYGAGVYALAWAPPVTLASASASRSGLT
jgi:hypothetical protein